MGGVTRRKLLIAVALGASLVWWTVVTVILTGDWHLSCTISGQKLGGMDCFNSTAIR